MPIETKETLCWKCRKATNPQGSDCEWAAKLQPVEGWEAIPTQLYISAKKYSPSYKVISCPKFERDV